MNVPDAVRRLVVFYENLAAADVARLPEFYTSDACFRDPFNDVHGVVSIQRIFDQMFEDLADCRFAIADTVVDEHAAMLVWGFTFRIRRYRPDLTRSIHGASHLRFDGDGRVRYHRDYWDAADEFYAQLPLIGPVMRFLKRRLA
jgi:hypothetical protein